MGASAALSVAIARWCQFQNWISEEELFEFSRQLENLFHGESSGVDIAVALSSQGIKFYRSQEYWPPIQLRWHPHWYLSYSGKKGMTSDCVNQVKKFGESHPLEARALDEKMLQSVELAEKALSASGSEEDLLQLKQSLDLGLESFSGWGLTTGVLGDHIQQLKDYGALAVKPTGSGDGGYVLSLWRQPPINVSPIDFIPL
jgi:mevalonate kinase